MPGTFGITSWNHHSTEILFIGGKGEYHKSSVYAYELDVRSGRDTHGPMGMKAGAYAGASLDLNLYIHVEKSKDMIEFSLR